MQFDRVIKLNIQIANPPPSLTYRGRMEIENLRIAFSVFKSESWSTNTANVKIWNLSQEKRNTLNNYGNEVKIFAGYRNESGAQLLFTGNSSLTSHIFAEPEIITVFDCGDGEKSLNLILATASFGANTPIKDVIEYYGGVLGLTVAPFELLEGNTYALGHKFSGIAKDGLDKACKAAGLNWSVQNNNIIITRQGVGSDKPPAEINPDNGMIGIPERYTDRRQYLYRALPKNGGAPNPGWKIRCLLRPDILPGDRVRIRSSRVDIDGVFYVISIRHEGDNYGPIFESLLEVIAI